MIKQLCVIMVAALTATVSAQNVTIKNEVLGSGTPGKTGFEEAKLVLNNDIFHAPQFLASYPTAATIWPRVVDVPCVKDKETGLKCEGYNWSPKMGRGEYLFFRPVVIEQPVQEVRVEVRETVVIKEVPAKKIRQ